MSPNNPTMIVQYYNKFNEPSIYIQGKHHKKSQNTVKKRKYTSTVSTTFSAAVDDFFNVAATV